MHDPFVCPKCGNDNQSMFDTWGHRREQVGLNCHQCGSSHVHIFKDVPQENVIPREIADSIKQIRRRSNAS